MCAGQAAFLDDACQDGEGGDAHRDGNEEREGQEGYLTAIAIVDEVGGQEPAEEGEEHAGVADHHRLAQLLTDGADVELHTDGVHEKDESELTQEVDVAQRFAGEEELGEVGREPAQDGRPEQDAGQNLAHDHRLPDALEEQPHDAAGDEDDDDLQEEQAEGRVDVLGHEREEDAEALDEVLRRVGRVGRVGDELVRLTFADDEVHRCAEEHDQPDIEQKTFEFLRHYVCCKCAAKVRE